MHYDPLLWLIPGLPLFAAAIVGLLGPRWLKSHSHWPVVIAAGLSCFLALTALYQLHDQQPWRPGPLNADAVIWFSIGGVTVKFHLVVDQISAVMLTAITFIGSWIAIFSIGYMHGDPGYPRFFAVFSLFLFSMCGLVMADNLIVLYLFWEGVGLCSYLLIGFWFAKPSAAAAARKAFLVTRLGDAGLALGIFLLWHNFGHTLEFRALFDNVRTALQNDPYTGTMLTVEIACLLIFCGAVGKSAQFPLHVWLPDAMEGPTPVSALIHAATMVTAGVYLVGRTMPLFVLAPAALAVVAFIGAFTALLAALIALTQHDLKRVMAYSTVSQLGYMFLALGSGQGDLAAFAVIAALFHLFTHAFFKALLFLASGSVMHAMGNVIDMRRFGGLRKVMPITHITFACGAAALAGFPLLSGFWSKDEVFSVVKQAGNGSAYSSLYTVLLYSGGLTALLTAFYTFRAYFRTFWGEERIPEEAGHHAHESPGVMTVPLIVLAVGAVLIGALVGPTHWFVHFVGRTTDFATYRMPVPEPHLDWWLLTASSVLAIAGIAIAWWMYVKSPGMADKWAAAVPGLYRLSQNRFYLDEIYRGIIVSPLVVVAVVSRFFDMLLDGIIDLIGRLPRTFGGLVRPVQNGLVQFYGLAMVMGTMVFLGILIWRSR